jgi:hypothetical protein
MRPGDDPSSSVGFLGKKESLIEVLAKDNDTVLGMGLTHQKLADFLHYVSKNNSPDGFEYNGRKYVGKYNAMMGDQGSPFQDGTSGGVNHSIVCLEDGATISFSALLPFMIDRYGFYEGKGTGYRLDPKEVAETAGFIPQPKEDPIVELIKDKNANVEIATANQIARLSALAEIGHTDLLGSRNYRIIPEDTEALFTIFDHFCKSDNWRLQTSRSTILSHLDIKKLGQKPLEAENVDLSTFTYLPEWFPELKHALLQSIESIEFKDKVDLSEFLEGENRHISRKGVIYKTLHKNYFKELAQKAKVKEAVK